MSKEGGEVEVSEPRRKSARILALAEEKKEKQKRNNSSANVANTNSLSSKGKAILSGNIGSFQFQQFQHRDHVFPSKTPAMPPPPLSSPKRSRKQKRLEDLDLSSLAQSQAQQDREYRTNGSSSTSNDQQQNGVSSIQWIPEKRILECVLDILQRRDKYKIFAQPVNPNEVEAYYTIIKEPMDFGTMRTKIHQGKYTSLEQFERDVFLISSNAMHFNSSTTIYYREARRMQELAQMVFGVLRSDPNKLDSQFSPTKGRQSKRLPTIREIKGLRTRLSRPSAFKIGASQLGSKDGGNAASPKRGRPPIHRPWAAFSSDRESLLSAVYNAPKVIVEDDTDENYGYEKSLLRFVKGLGPIAHKIVARKLINGPAKPPNPTQSQTPLVLPNQTTQSLLLQSPISFPQRTASHNLLQKPIDSLNSPGSANLAYNQKNTFLNLLKGNYPMSFSSGIQIHEPQKTNSDPMFPLKPPSVSHDILGKMPMLDDIDPSTNFNVFGNTFTGNRTYSSGQNMANFGQNVVQQQQKTNVQNRKFWLASHLKVVPVFDLINGKRFRTVDMIAEANKRGKQLAVDDLDHDQLFSNWQKMIRGKQKVVDDDHDHEHEHEPYATNSQSRIKDFIHKSNKSLKSTFLSPSPMEITRFHTTAGSAQAGTTSNWHAQAGTSSNWQYQMDLNSLAIPTQTDQFLEGLDNGISSLQPLLSNDQDHNNPFPYASSSARLGLLPMPLYSETSSIVHDIRARPSSSDHDPRGDFTLELLSLNDAQQPDLALQL